MVSDCEELVGGTHRRLKLLNCTEYQGRFDHKSWLHIDIKTDYIEKEVTRLENLGAGVVEQISK